MKRFFYPSVLIISAAAFTLLAVFYPGLLDLNIRAAAKIQSIASPPLTALMIFITSLGAWFVLAPATALLCVLPKTRMTAGIPSALALVVSAALNGVLKHIFALPRPDVNRLIAENGFTFPSGHSMSTAAFIGILALLIIRQLNGRRAKFLTAAAAAAYVLLVGFSRVYLGVHYPIDVIGGYCAGIAVIGLFTSARVCDMMNSDKTERSTK